MKKTMILLSIILLASTAHGDWPSNYYSLTPEQQIDVLMTEGYTGDDLDEIGKATSLPILYSLLSKYTTTDEKKAETVIGMISYFHNDSSIEILMQAWELNKKLENEIIQSISSIYEKNNNSDKAYQAMIKLIKAPRYDYGEELGLDNILFDELVKEADKSKVPYLIRFLKDTDMPKPWEIIKKLGDIGDPGVTVPVIAEILKHEYPERRRVAAETLGKIGSSLAINPLKDAVKVEVDISVKMDMAAQLVKLGEFLYLEEILKILETPKWANFSDVRGWAFTWLKELTGQDFGEDVTAWRKWFEEERLRVKASNTN